MKAKSVMSRDVFRCTADTSMAEAARRMWEHDCGALPVVGPDDRLEGIVTDRDICMCAGMNGRSLADLPVREAMSTDVATVREDDAVEVVHERMRARKVRRVPVVGEGGRVVGIVSLADLCLGAERAGATRSRSQLHEVATTVARVSEQRAPALM